MSTILSHSYYAKTINCPLSLDRAVFDACLVPANTESPPATMVCSAVCILSTRVFPQTVFPSRDFPANSYSLIRGIPAGFSRKIFPCRSLVYIHRNITRHLDSLLSFYHMCNNSGCPDTPVKWDQIICMNSNALYKYWILTFVYPKNTETHLHASVISKKRPGVIPQTLMAEWCDTS